MIGAITLERRSLDWYRAVQPGIQRSGMATAAPTLGPSWALADLLSCGGWDGMGIDPDDLSLADMTDRDRRHWARVAAAFALPDDILEAVEDAPTPRGTRP